MSRMAAFTPGAGGCMVAGMRALILVMLVLSACAGAPGACRLEKATDLPVRLVGTVPVLDVLINGQRAALVLDTGSNATVLTRRAAQRLGVAALPDTVTVGGAGGQSAVGVARLDRLGIGAVERTGVRVLLGDAPAPPLDGVLGIDVLVEYELELDLRRGRAALYRARPYPTARPPWEGEVTQLPVVQRPRAGHLFVSLTLDGEPLLGMLDSGASRTTLSTQSAEDARLTRRRLATLPAGRGQAVNPGGVVVRMAPLPRAAGSAATWWSGRCWGSWIFRRMSGNLLVGADYLGSRRVWFSFLLGRVFVAH